MSDKPLTPCRAIKLYCSTQCLATAQEVTMCPNSECPLHAFRSGHNARRAGIGRHTAKGERTQRGKFSSSRDGEKIVNIRAYSRDGKLRIVLPSGDVLNIQQGGQ